MTEEKTKLPLYRCHKEVRAAKIEHFLGSLAGTDYKLRFVGDKAGAHDVEVSREWIDKHDAKEGGYLVEYADGYRSYSPAEAFEGGYALVGDDK